MEVPEKSHWRRILSSPVVLTLIIVAGAACVLYAPVFQGQLPVPARSLTGLTWGAPTSEPVKSIFRDRISQAYPYHLFAAKAFQSARLPTWNNLIFAGTTFMANGQAGLFSPFKFPFWWLPPWLSYSIVTLLQSAVGGLGMYLLGRKLGWKAPAGVVAGLALTLSAPFVMRMTVTTMSAVIATLPWVLMAALNLHRTLSWRSAAWLAVSVAILVLAGHVQLAVFSLAYAGLWVLIWWQRRDWKRRTLLFVTGFLLGLGITAVQMLPVKEALSHAYRQPGGVAWSKILNPAKFFRPNIHQAATLTTLITPKALGDEAHYRGPGNFLEANFFFGPFALVLVAFSFFAHRHKLWRWTFAIAVLVAGFYIFPRWWDLLGKFVPWLTVTPVWRASFFLVFSLAILAGIGTNEVVTKWLPKSGWMAVGIVALSSLWLWQGILPFAPRSIVFPTSPLLTKAAELTTNGTRLWTPDGALDQFMPYHIPIVVGYDSVYPHEYLELWTANATMTQRNQLVVTNPNDQLLGVTGANVMLTKGDIDASWTEVMREGDWKLATRNNPQPAFHTVQAVTAETSAAQLGSIDVATTALVEGALPNIEASARTTIASVQVDDAATTVELTTDKQTLLVTNMQWYPGWQVNSGSQRLTTIRVNHAFIGVVVPAGQHTITIRYQPRSLLVGIIISLCSLLALAIVGWYLPRRKQTPPQGGAVGKS